MNWWWNHAVGNTIDCACVMCVIWSRIVSGFLPHKSGFFPLEGFSTGFFHKGVWAHSL